MLFCGHWPVPKFPSARAVLVMVQAVLRQGMARHFFNFENLGQERILWVTFTRKNLLLLYCRGMFSV